MIERMAIVDKELKATEAKEKEAKDKDKGLEAVMKELDVELVPCRDAGGQAACQTREDDLHRRGRLVRALAAGCSIVLMCSPKSVLTTTALARNAGRYPRRWPTPWATHHHRRSSGRPTASSSPTGRTAIRVPVTK